MATKFCTKCRSYSDKFSSEKQTWCKPCKAEAHREYLKRKPRTETQIKRDNLRKLYGISLEQFNIMLESQNSKCAICFRDFTAITTKPSVDHDHKTGRVRGLLCSHCNRGIGQFKENVEALGNAITYLERYK